MKSKKMNFSIYATFKTIMKISLVVTGASMYLLDWVDTPFGAIPVFQIFGTLNIITAIGLDLNIEHKQVEGK